MQVTNNSDISLTLAVWLLSDDYDYNNDPNYVSVTKLMRPLRQLILPSRIPQSQREAPDVVDFVARKLGHALHDSIEKAWTKNYAGCLKLLGYPDKIIDRVIINPPEGTNLEGLVPVYLEQRATRQIDGYTIGGKFDMIAEGRIEDNKSTSAMTWVYGSRDDEHQLQGSMYRWLNPDKVTEDYMRINYIFTDWSKFMAKQNPKYPQKRVEHKDIQLLSLAQTEEWIRNKLALIRKYKNSLETQIPECTPEELWQSEPKYSYYSDPAKTDGRSTKNFDSIIEANQFRAEKGKGIVITRPGEPKRCQLYCDAYEACTQKDRYFPA